MLEGVTQSNLQTGAIAGRVLSWKLSLAIVRFQKGKIMPAAVRIKAGKYGSAIGLLLERGGAFQTRHERTLIVDAAQKEALEQAGLIEAVGSKPMSGKGHGQKKDAG
jgi:hypothetical protein